MNSSKNATIIVIVDKDGLPVVSMGGTVWAFSYASMMTVDELLEWAKKKRDYLNQPVTTGFFKWKTTAMRHGAPYRLMALTFHENPGTKNMVATVHEDADA